MSNASSKCWMIAVLLRCFLILAAVAFLTAADIVLPFLDWSRDKQFTKLATAASVCLVLFVRMARATFAMSDTLLNRLLGLGLSVGLCGGGGCAGLFAGCVKSMISG